MNKTLKHSNIVSKKFISIGSFFTLVGLFMLSCSDSQPSKDVHQHLLEKGIDSVQANLILENAKVFPNKTQFSIALISDSATIFVGLEKRNDTLISVENRNADYEIGSVTMLFTSTLLADFVINGKLALTDSLSDYLPVSLKDSLEITFGELANHTSGLPLVPTKMLIKSLFKMDNPYQDFDDAKMSAYLQSGIELDATPGTSFAYSNLGMGVLGYSLSMVGQEPFGKLLQSRIFKHYNLNNTTIIRADVQDSLVAGLNKNGKKATNWDMAAMAGAGGVISTASDLSKFAKAQFNPNDKVLALTRKVTFTIDQKKSIGLGWKILQNDDGSAWLTQSGGTGGYSASVVVDTLSHTAVIVLSNVSASNDYKDNIETMCFGLMKTLKPKTGFNAPRTEH